jgi:hypothetical protein
LSRFEEGRVGLSNDVHSFPFGKIVLILEHKGVLTSVLDVVVGHLLGLLWFQI